MQTLNRSAAWDVRRYLTPALFPNRSHSYREDFVFFSSPASSPFLGFSHDYYSIRSFAYIGKVSVMKVRKLPFTRNPSSSLQRSNHSTSLALKATTLTESSCPLEELGRELDEETRAKHIDRDDALVAMW
jgi:hypothetical protein